MIKKILKEPYRLFFPVGLLYLVVGVAIWLPQGFQESPPYPLYLHRYLVLNGFLFSFIGGFLMTALPQFSKSHPANLFDILGLLLVTFLGALGIYGQSLKGAVVYLSLVSFFQGLILLLFLVGRFLKKKSNPPYTFFLVALGLLLWTFFGLFRFLSPETSHLLSEYALQHEAAINLLLLGVGTRLFPGILGHQQVVQKQKAFYEKDVSFFKTIPLSFSGLGAVFFGSYFVPSTYVWVANYGQLIIVGLIGFFFWRLHHLPQEKSMLTWNLWVGLWLFLLGYASKAFWPAGGIHGQHIFFVGSYFLLILVVATRVMRAHGGIPKSQENSKVLALIGGLAVLSMATRVSSYVMINSYDTHLSYAAALLILATLVWVGKIGPWLFSEPKE